MLIGFHVSVSGSLALAVDRALELECTTFQIFSRNPRGWKFRPLREEEVKAFRTRRRQAGFTKAVAHMPYLPNLGTPRKLMQRKSRASLVEEVKRCNRLGIEYVVAHLGSHMGAGSMVGVRNVSEACNEALQASPGRTMIVLENMAGQNNSIGSRFEELRLILDGVNQRNRVGVCFDTCHAYACGFDLSSRGGVEDTIRLFDELVGLSNLKVVHLNDSKGALGSRIDRHEHLGKGRISLEGFRSFLGYLNLERVPIIMETPMEAKSAEREDMRIARQLVS